MRSRTPGLVLPAVYALRDAARLRSLSLMGKFGRIIRHKYNAGGGQMVTYRLKVTHQDIPLVDPFVGKKAISRPRIRPVLAVLAEYFPPQHLPSAPATCETALSHTRPQNGSQKSPGQTGSLIAIHCAAPESVPDKKSHATRAG